MSPAVEKMQWLSILGLGMVTHIQSSLLSCPQLLCTSNDKVGQRGLAEIALCLILTLSLCWKLGRVHHHLSLVDEDFLPIITPH